MHLAYTKYRVPSGPARGLRAILYLYRTHVVAGACDYGFSLRDISMNWKCHASAEHL